MDNSNLMETLKQLKGVANYFSQKTPKGITFTDADNYDQAIYELFQKWQKAFPDRNFKEVFPVYDQFWEELATWNYQDDWDREKCEKIINLSKRASSEMRSYIAGISV